MSDHNKSVVWNKKGLDPEELATYLDGVWWAVEELPRAERAWRQPRVQWEGNFVTPIFGLFLVGTTAQSLSHGFLQEF